LLLACRGQLAVVFGCSQGAVDDLLQAGGDQDIAHLFFGFPCFVAMLDREGFVHERDADKLIADHARHFLGQIGGDAHVEPVPGRHAFEQHLPRVAVQGEGRVRPGVGRDFVHALDLEVQAAEDIGDLAERDAHAQQAACVTERGVDDRQLLLDGIGVDHAGHDMAACVLAHEVGGAPACDGIERGRYAACEAVAGFAGDAELLGGAPGADGLEGRRLQQNVARAVADFAVQPAHDAGDGDGSRRVRDHEHGFVQRAFSAV